MDPEERARRKAKKAKRKALDRLSRSTVSVDARSSKQPRAVLGDLPVNKHAPEASTSSSSSSRDILRPISSKKKINKLRKNSETAQRSNSNLGEDEAIVADPKEDERQHPNKINQDVPSSESLARKVGFRSKSATPTPKLPRDVDDIDRIHGKNPLYAPEYARDVHAFKCKLQAKYKLKHDFMRDVQYGSRGVTPQKRAILVDWLVDVTEELLLNTETLYLSVGYVDRYLARKRMTHDKLQLLGLACLWIATKFEETFKVNMRSLLNLADGAYRPDELLKMEASVIKVLEYGFAMTTAKTFMRRFQRAARITQQEKVLGNYLLELSLTSYELAGYVPSLIAAAAVFVARVTLFASDSHAVVTEPSADPRLVDDDDLWSTQLRHYCGFSLEQIAAVVRKLHELHTQANRSNERAIFQKYSLKVFFRVATKIPPYSGQCMPPVTSETILNMHAYTSDASSSSSSFSPPAAPDSRRRVSDTSRRCRQPLAEVSAHRSAHR
ncbi:G2/mitotic-specific cyclin-A [Hondaea fermentalgiana]|uniref:G2/mitotic-specific cyclin-A n=1 Tax=Hondaea fermentalgiana TaxID=2315210 RepID=A0A2R5GG63_9STRA|nr:G2/mitotic-specific cyclin-A [Hondaea fermentalgiana]|eukprot:GBG29329.1 G2/mitotic-specific cyclin-A [Hondaea fermentalgiana]